MAVVTTQISSGANDATFLLTYLGWSPTAASGILGNQGGQGGGHWLRFTGVAVANAATITAARLLLNNDSGGSNGTINAQILVEQADNPTMPADTAGASGRTLSTKVDWDFTAATAGTGEYGSVDIAARIQDIVNRAGWVSGNAINIVVRDDGSAGNNYWQVENYDGTAAKAAKLEITYASGPTGSPWNYYAQMVSALCVLVMFFRCAVEAIWRKCLGDFPSTLESPLNLAGPDSNSLGPLSNAHRFAVIGQQGIVAAVAVLLGRCGPSHIARLVVAILIWVAIQGMLGGWSRSHVSKECREVLPAVAHLNPAPAVDGILLAIGISATAEHRHPYCVLWPRGKTVDRRAFNRSFFMVAPAALGVAGLEAVNNDCCRSTAGAFASPERAAATTSRYANLVRLRCEPSKDAACQVLKVRTSCNYKCFSHDSALHESVALWREPPQRYSVVAARFIIPGA